MLRNYFKIAWRMLLKNKGYAAINIAGLAIGMACCLLIAVYIRNELSYDQYHVKKDRIYRVLHGYKTANAAGSTEAGQAGDYTYDVWGNAPVGKALKADFGEIQEVVQFSGRISLLLKHEDRSFQEENVFCADSNVFKVFDWKLLAGDPATALANPYTVVLTRTAAKKYFGDENPIGKTLEGGDTWGRAKEGTYTVSGIMQDVPSNSHFTFDMLLSMSSFRQSRPEVFSEWGYVDFYTYFLVSEHADPSRLPALIPDFIRRHNASNDGRYTIAFEPLAKAYLHSTANRQPGATGNLNNLYIFGVIGLFILAIACINFMNLATSRSMERAREVGVRKAVGAERQELIRQFFGESLLMVLAAALLALLTTVALLPVMQDFVGKHFAIEEVFSTRTLAAYLVIVVITGLLAGIYPAIVLSGFNPVTVLKGSFRNTPGGVGLRKTLVVFQFSLSIALIVGTTIVFSQLEHLQHTNPGFRKDQMLVIDFSHDGAVRNQLEAVKNTFLREKEVVSVSASQSVPGTFFPNARTNVESPGGRIQSEDPALYEVDVDFINHFGIEMAAGRAYSRDFPADTLSSLIVNEAAARLFGYKNPADIIGRKFSQWGRKGRIIGVVKDFNYLSLHKQVEPLTLRLEPSSSRYLTLRINSENMQGTIGKLEKIWKKVAPHRPYLYSFLDESFNRQYEADRKFRGLFSLFAGLAVFIACLGLLGLSTYTAQLRTKEIGIRKVLGASVPNLVRLLSVDFVKLVLIAALIASPVAWWAMSRWLEDFAYRIQIQWWMFASAGLAAILIALLTVGWQAVRAAGANPVRSLRTE